MVKVWRNNEEENNIWWRKWRNDSNEQWVSQYSVMVMCERIMNTWAIGGNMTMIMRKWQWYSNLFSSLSLLMVWHLMKEEVMAWPAIL